MAQIGSVIDNKYEVLKQIGKGGMSTVYLAMDKRLNKQWAIKEIEKNANDKNNEVVVQSLLVEANLMKRLDHPTLPRIVDIIDNGKKIYVVMDYIEGESLDKILKMHDARPQEVVIEWAKQLCDVLRYLHMQTPPIIYRDMKPANVMLKPEGTLKLIDFGIAREFKEHNISDTVSLGTRGYAAPEQFGGMGQTDARTDIYCLGVTLYHLVTGQNPTEPPYELYPIRQWNPHLSSGLEAIIQKCTQMNPDDRYQNCDELMYALEHYDEMDETYKKKQKKKLKGFITATAVSAVMLISGITFKILANSENNKNYESKVGISISTAYDEKVESYKEAMDLYPYRKEAYLRLLEAYNDNNMFNDVQSAEFMEYYNKAFNEKNEGEYDKGSEDYADINFNAGITYMYMYAADDENVSFKVRALKSYPFFREVVNGNNKEYENYKLAKSYYTICDFYKNYVANQTNTKEPGKDIYEELISSLYECVESLEEYDNENLPYIKLTMYEAISDLLFGQRKGFVATGIGEEKVMNLMYDMYEKAESLSVTQEKSLNKQSHLLDVMEQYRMQIEKTYDISEKR